MQLMRSKRYERGWGALGKTFCPPSDLNSLRPISKFSFLAKVLEKIITDQLLAFILLFFFFFCKIVVLRNTNLVLEKNMVLKPLFSKS